jgi:hypothetical protein
MDCVITNIRRAIMELHPRRNFGYQAGRQASRYRRI